jgi:hypothetical protein
VDVYKHKLGERVDNDPNAMLVIFVQEMDSSFTKVNLASQTCLDLTKKPAPYDGTALRLVIISPTDGCPPPDNWTPRLMTVVSDKAAHLSGVYVWNDGKIQRVGTPTNAIWWDYCFRMIASIATLDPKTFLEYIANDKTVEISKDFADNRCYLDLGRFEIPAAMPDTRTIYDSLISKEHLGLEKTEGFDNHGKDAHPKTREEHLGERPGERPGEGNNTGEVPGIGEGGVRGEHGIGGLPEHPEGRGRWRAGQIA